MQWLTAGGGVVHGENFPLVHDDQPNTLKLFQIWLNLPKKNKMVPPHFVMHWAENMKKLEGTGGASCTVVVGQLGEAKGSVPPPNSWGADPANDVGVYQIELPPGGSRFVLPPSPIGMDVNRVAYITEGSSVAVSGTNIPGQAAVTLRGDSEAVFVNRNASATAEILILQGRPIKEPVAQRGPFVMNTQEEIAQAFADYRRTQFGGWPWAADAMAFAKSQGRFASRVDPKTGKQILETPPSSSASS
jgi:redox-sensitive bicupin YhaK (pirin superfamily)